MPTTPSRIAFEWMLLAVLATFWGASYTFITIGVVFLGEALSPTAWAGLACIVAGVVAMTVPAHGGPRLTRLRVR